MQTINLKPIGIVKNNFDKPTPFNDIKAQPSTIVIYDEYAEALTNIEEVHYLDIVFNFHLSGNHKLAHTTHFGDFRGVFASRSPFRPNLIGVTRVKLKPTTAWPMASSLLPVVPLETTRLFLTTTENRLLP